MAQSYFIKSRLLSYIIIRSSVPFKQVQTLTYKARIQRLYDDGIDVKQQTVEINSKEHIRRCTLHKNDDIWNLYKTVHPNVKTLGDALNEGYIQSRDGPCVGFIQSVNGSDSLQWLSYSKVKETSECIGSYLWSKKKLTPMKSKVAILSLNRPEYLFAEQACYMYGFIVVSLYTTYDPAAIFNVFKRTKVEILVIDNLQRIQSFQDELFKNTQLKEIIVMDDTNYVENTQIRSLSSIFDSMKNNDLRERPSIDPDSIATYILTSGTTGEPKIAMLSHENLLATAKSHIMRLEKSHIKRPLTDRHCSFLPMAHVYERFILLQAILGGSQLVFCPEPEKLPYYLSIVKPTQASVVPRVLNRVYDRIMTEVNKSVVKKFLVQQALREKPAFLSRFVFRKVKNLFGNELKVMITAAAPITPDVIRFFRIALNIPIMEGYGQTESAGTAGSSHPTDLSFATIGSPTPAVEMKLIDVPGTNYRSENNQGEVCVRGPNVFKGYYDDEAKTKEVLDKDGWLHTGDVGEWTTNGSLRIIDRVKHVFKLSQGQYVAPERLEDIYIRSLWIAHIFIDGISTESSVVAIVVPDEEYVRKNYQSINEGTTFKDLCKDEKLKDIILSDLKRLATTNKLKIHEAVSNIYLYPELFSQSNQLITVTLKTRRTIARQRFAPIIKSLYPTNPSI